MVVIRSRRCYVGLNQTPPCNPGSWMRTIPRSRMLWAIGLVLAAASPANAQAQSGVVRFANDFISGANAPFYDTDGTTKLAGSTFRAALYVGPLGSLPDSWMPSGPSQPFRPDP